MNTKIPPTSEIMGRLKALSLTDVQALAATSEVPLTTLLKIRSGVTTNPGIETVRRFAKHFKQPRKAKAVA